MKKKIWKIIPLCIAALAITGCAKTVDLTEEEQEVIAEYAARALLNFDQRYNAKYEVDILDEVRKEAKNRMESGVSASETETSEEPDESSTPKPTATPTPEPQVSEVPPTATPELAVSEAPEPEPEQPTQNAQQKISPYDLGKLFGIEGVEVSYIGFEAVDSYPVIPDQQIAFKMDAAQGAKLIVAKFELVNDTNTAKTCNIVGQNIRFQMRFNDSDYVGVQKTLLTDDFSSLNCILQPKERTQAVIISQVAAGYETTINRVDLITRIGGENKLILLQ